MLKIHKIDNTGKTKKNVYSNYCIIILVKENMYSNYCITLALELILVKYWSWSALFCALVAFNFKHF